MWQVKEDGAREWIEQPDPLMDLLDTGAVERLTPEEWRKRMEAWERLVKVNEHLERRKKK